jgi:hypothetical protein
MHVLTEIYRSKGVNIYGRAFQRDAVRAVDRAGGNY